VQARSRSAGQNNALEIRFRHRRHFFNPSLSRS
jgi:hypothetical protein